MLLGCGNTRTQALCLLSLQNISDPENKAKQPKFSGKTFVINTFATTLATRYLWWFCPGIHIAWTAKLYTMHCSSPLFLPGRLNLPALFLPILCFMSEVEFLNNEICYYSLTCLSPSFEPCCFLGLCDSICLWLVDKAKTDSWVQPSKRYKTYVNVALILQQKLASLEHSLNKCHLEQKIWMYMITWSPSFKPCSCPLQSVPEKKSSFA